MVTTFQMTDCAFAKSTLEPIFFGGHLVLRSASTVTEGFSQNALEPHTAAVAVAAVAAPAAAAAAPAPTRI